MYYILLIHSVEKIFSRYGSFLPNDRSHLVPATTTMSSSALNPSLWNDFDSDGEYASDGPSRKGTESPWNSDCKTGENDTRDILGSYIKEREAKQKEKAKEAEQLFIERQKQIESYKDLFVKKNNDYPFWNPKKIAPSSDSLPDVDVPISVRRIRSLDGTNYEEIHYGEGGSTDLLSTSVMPKGSPFTMEEYIELFCKKENGRVVYLTAEEMKDRYWKNYDGKKELNIGDIILCEFQGMKDTPSGRLYCGRNATECTILRKIQNDKGEFQYEGKMLHGGFADVIKNIYPSEIVLKRIRLERRTQRSSRIAAPSFKEQNGS